MDFRKESYSETLQDFTAVIDTLGREKEGPQSLLMEAKGAAYFSLQPAILKVTRQKRVWCVCSCRAVTVPDSFLGVGVIFRGGNEQRVDAEMLQSQRFQNWLSK